MIVGVMSDSHDHLANIGRAVKVFSERKIAALIHGGDLCSPFVFRELEKLKSFCPSMYAVFGNNDGDRVLLTEKGRGFCTFRDGALSLEMESRRIAVMHYPDVAESLHRSGDFDLVIYGHNHTARVEGEKRILLNPGSCAGYLTDRATIAVVDLQSLGVELIELD
ncbi:MAG: metallophosphoesterase [Spirochaetaceae bacterium]|nr:MAG: metallophosphoesterase [Spirochaetaceae bacterium]